MVAAERSSAISTTGLDTNDTLSRIGKHCREHRAHRVHPTACILRILHWHVQ